MHQLFHELICNVFHHDDPFSRHANLTLVEKRSGHGSGSGGIEIRVIEHNQRSLSAEFQDTALENLRGFHGNNLTYTGGPCEINSTDSWVLDQRSGDIQTVSGLVGDNRDDIFRQATATKEIDNHLMGVRAMF